MSTFDQCIRQHAEERARIKAELAKAAQPARRNYTELQRVFWLNQNRFTGAMATPCKKLHSL